MDSQLYINYEISDDISNKVFSTRSREEALAYFDRGWYVVENHVTVSRPSMFVSTRSEVSIVWNNNSEFERD
jgi:hypothetical protein